MSSQFTYNGNVIEVEVVNENPQSEKDLKIGGALIQALSFENQIETQVDEDGNTWFKAKDITDNLGYKNSAQALKDNVISPDISGRYTSSSGQGRTVNFINESGLYSLIISSKLESAKKFRHWVTSEVLPSIGKTGSYSTNTPPLVMRTIGDVLARQHKAIQSTNKSIREQIGKPIDGSRMTRSATNISRMSNALAFGKHYDCEMRQILTEEESGHLYAIMKAFEAAHKKNPHLELVDIKAKVADVFEPMIITKEEIERRLKAKKELKELEQKKQLK
jgi:hypothetical protein